MYDLKMFKLEVQMKHAYHTYVKSACPWPTTNMTSIALHTAQPVDARDKKYEMMDGPCAHRTLVYTPLSRRTGGMAGRLGGCYNSTK